jgi:arsenite/tail-anchored protein-transporting ATPase
VDAARLLALIDAPFTFVVGKGGVGKTTTAGALALGRARSGRPTLLISTDPAHSIGDLFDLGSDATDEVCGETLSLEQFDARAWADRWIERVSPDVTSLITAGTYLDEADAASFLDLSLPGIDEVMAALRLCEEAAAGRAVIVDTAPTGHTLRLLGSGELIRSWTAALAAMAAKAGAVAGAFAGRRVEVAGERLIAELRRSVDLWETTILPGAAVIVVTRGDAVVAAESRRLADALSGRSMNVAAIVCAATAPATAARLDLPDAPRFAVPPLEPGTGCGWLGSWTAAMVAIPERGAPTMGRDAADASAAAGAPASGPTRATGAAAAALSNGSPLAAGEVADWLRGARLELLFFAGKGGVGKSTCAAAAALVIAQSRPVRLYSTDPAGSLGDVLGTHVTAEPVEVAPSLRAMQIDAPAALAELRDEYHREIGELFDRIGLGGDAALDRRVALAIWELAPPGVDEIAAVIGIIDAADDGETIVIDAAPTGHFLRLIAMPGIALDWIHALMRILLKYRAAGTLDTLAQRLLTLARQLKSLQAALTDEKRTGAFIVTLDEPLVAAETARLSRDLAAAGMPRAATILNRAAGAGTAAGSGRTIRAPRLAQPPVGVPCLRDFVRQWEFAA